MTLPHDIRKSIEDMPPWQISEGIGLLTPDGPTSPGASMLDCVRSAILERIDALEDDNQLSDVNGAMEDEYHLLADDVVPIGTHERWSAFADLGAWDQEIGDYGEIDAQDLTNSVAGVALYLIADRAAHWIVEDIDGQMGDRIDAALEYASALGAEDGESAVGWWEQDAIGGRVTGDVRPIAERVLAGLEDGDPEILDALPTADLSDQHADGPTISSMLYRNGLDGLDPTCDIAQEIGDNYETAFSTAVENAVTKACRSALETES